MSAVLGAGRFAAFLYLVSTIVVMASERVYWYWAGFNLGSVFEMGAFYVIPTAAALWALAHTRATRIHHVMLAGAFFAFIVEGVLTPIIYADGPLPVLAALFVGWHGMLAFVGFWYLTRRWLLERRTKLLAVVSAGVGVLWGIWAMTASIANPGEILEELDLVPEVLTPDGFAVYALGVGVILAAAHWLIGYVWPTNWKPTKVSTISIVLVVVAYMAVAVIVVVPWAPLKLAVLLGGTYWLMKREREGLSSEPTIFQELAGKVRLRDTASLLLLPLTAAATYSAVWAMNLPDSVLGGLYWVFVATQVIGGGVAYVVAARRALRQVHEPVTKSINT